MPNNKIQIILSDNEKIVRTYKDDPPAINLLKMDKRVPEHIKQLLTEALIRDYKERILNRPEALRMALPYYKIDFCKEIIFDNISCDMICTLGNEETRTEEKEVEDLWASMVTGHLGNQICDHIAKKGKGFIMVFGSTDDIMQAVPQLTKNGFKHFSDSVRDENVMRAFVSDCWGMTIPVMYLSRNPVDSFVMALGAIKGILKGSTPHAWLPSYKGLPKQEASLCAFQGISTKWSQSILQELGPSWFDVATKIKRNPALLAGVKSVSSKQTFGTKRAFKALVDMGMDKKTLLKLSNDWEIDLNAD